MKKLYVHIYIYIFFFDIHFLNIYIYIHKSEIIGIKNINNRRRLKPVSIQGPKMKRLFLPLLLLAKQRPLRRCSRFVSVLETF